MRTENIRIRDPYILPYDGKYYMYGTGNPNVLDINLGRQFWCYISEDLKEWSEPILCFDAPDDFWGTENFWAPEIHIYHGKFYMFASFYAPEKMRATQVLVADNPLGPYQTIGAPITPSDWMCLDGTFYIEDEVPYLVFSHEWTQVKDGEIAYIQLSKDLTKSVGEAKVLFRASESGWTTPITVGDNKEIYVTDGPWLVKDETGLVMFWSSFQKGSYAVGIAVSESGKLDGPWTHCKELLFEKDGGHGMMFEGFDGKLYFTIHQPNGAPLERAHFYEITREKQGYRMLDRNAEK